MIVVAFDAFGFGRDLVGSLQDRGPFVEGYCGNSIRFEPWSRQYPQHYPCYLARVTRVKDLEPVLAQLPPATAKAWRLAVGIGLLEEQADEAWAAEHDAPPLKERVVFLPPVTADGRLFKR